MLESIAEFQLFSIGLKEFLPMLILKVYPIFSENGDAANVENYIFHPFAYITDKAMNNADLLSFVTLYA